jgi:hypothetical protein
LPAVRIWHTKPFFFQLIRPFVAEGTIINSWARRLVPLRTGNAFACGDSETVNHSWLFILALLIAPIAHAQQIEKVQPSGKVRDVLLAKPIALAHEVRSTAVDFATFRDKQSSILTFAQIGAAAADAETSLYNFRNCASCREVGVSRYFVGVRPDAHKYIVGGIVEIGMEAVAAHYFRSRGPARNKYWRLLWTLPQSFSLYEHAQAAHHNAGLDLACYNTGSRC